MSERVGQIVNRIRENVGRRLVFKYKFAFLVILVFYNLNKEKKNSPEIKLRVIHLNGESGIGGWVSATWPQTDTTAR